MKILRIVKTDLRIFFGDWKAVLLLMGLPFAFICLFYVALSPVLTENRFIQKFDIAIVDKEDSVESRMLINQLIGSESTKKLLNVQKESEEQALKDLDDDKLVAAIIIPEGFTYSVASGKNMPFTVVANKARPMYAAQIRNYMQTATNLVSAAQSGVWSAYVYYSKARSEDEFYKKEYSGAVMDFTMQAMGRNAVFTDRKVSDIPDVTAAEYFTAALLSVFIMFAAIPGMKFIVNERRYGISSRMKAAPVGVAHIIIARMVTIFIIGAMQMLTVIGLTAWVFKAYWGGSPYNIVMMFAASIFVAGGWALFVAAIARTSAAADVLGNLSILLMAILGGCIYPLTSMPDYIKKISVFIPNQSMINGFLTIFTGDSSLSVLPYVQWLLACGALLMIVAIPAYSLRRRC